MFKLSTLITALVLTLSIIFSVSGCKAPEDGTSSVISSEISSNETSNLSSEVSSEESSSDISSTVSTVSKPTVTYKYPKAVEAAKGKSSQRYGYGFGLQTDESNRPILALNQQNKYKHLNFLSIKDKEENSLYLTFDNGWENGLTPSYLDTLKEKGVKAVFFLNKSYVVANKAIVKRMIDEGHVVANHSANHQDLTKLSADEIACDIMDLHNYMLREFNYEMHLFRPPSGTYSEVVLAVAKALNYKTVEWSFAYSDWDTENQWEHEKALNYMKEKLCGGGIYLLHTVSSTTGAVLGDFIDYAKSEGYTLSLLENTQY